MDQQLTDWLAEFRAEFVFSHDSIHQARHNMHSFSWEEEARRALAIADLVGFVEGCSDVVAEQVRDRSAVFYAWADELAGQLRFSAICGEHEELPFGCVVVLSQLEEVAERVILMDGATWSEGEGFLKVWAREIGVRHAGH